MTELLIKVKSQVSVAILIFTVHRLFDYKASCIPKTEEHDDTLQQLCLKTGLTQNEDWKYEFCQILVVSPTLRQPVS